ncbi:hypothetical protein Tco_0474780 [Tanacetum coccineum]
MSTMLDNEPRRGSLEPERSVSADMAVVGGSREELSRSKQPQELLNRVLEFVDEDHEKFLKRIKARTDR